MIKYDELHVTFKLNYIHMKPSLILFIIFFAYSATTAIAQHDHKGHHEGHGYDKEKIESMKVGFLTKKLDLSSSEAQEFWPVYNEYEKSRHELRTSFHEKFKVPEEKLDDMTDAEAEAMIDNVMKYKQEKLDIDKKYHEEFKKVLPVRKVAKLYKARDEFKRYLLKKLRENHSKKK